MYFILIVLILSLSSIECGHSHERFSNENRLTKLNQTVQVLLSSIYKPVQQKNQFTKTRNLTGVQTFWNILPPLVQVLLLNQTKLVNSTNLTSSNWNSLPSDVQQTLLNQQSSLLNLSFDQWGWVASNSSLFASSTLFSLFPSKIQTILPNVTNILSPLKFNLQIDLGQLEQVLTSTFKQPKSNIVIKFLNSFIDQIEDLFESIDFTRFSAQQIFWQTVKQAKSFLRFNKNF